MVALHGRVRSTSIARLQGYNGSWSSDAAAFGNQFYVTLLGETWQPVPSSLGGVLQYKAVGKDMYSHPNNQKSKLHISCLLHYFSHCFNPRFVPAPDI
jgi:catalase (peroxidase I)